MMPLMRVDRIVALSFPGPRPGVGPDAHCRFAAGTRNTPQSPACHPCHGRTACTVTSEPESTQSSRVCFSGTRVPGYGYNCQCTRGRTLGVGSLLGDLLWIPGWGVFGQCDMPTAILSSVCALHTRGNEILGTSHIGTHYAEPPAPKNTSALRPTRGTTLFPRPCTMAPLGRARAAPHIHHTCVHAVSPVPGVPGYPGRKGRHEMWP
eukprot:649945-Rhodomonas_salina.4